MKGRTGDILAFALLVFGTLLFGCASSTGPGAPSSSRPSPEIVVETMAPPRPVPWQGPAVQGGLALAHDGDLWLQPLPNGTESRVTHFGDVADPHFSPGGDLVLFERRGEMVTIPGELGFEYRERTWWVAPLEGGAPYQVLDAADLPGRPWGETVTVTVPSLPYAWTWLPDGQTVLFTTEDRVYGAMPNDDLWGLDLESGQLDRRLPAGQGGRPGLAPDGQEVLLSTATQIAAAGVDGRHLRTLLTFDPVPTYTEVPWIPRPQWIDDGTARVAIPGSWTGNGPITATLWLLRPATGEAEALGQIRLAALDEPLWSPDGSRLAYAGPDGKLVLADGDGQNPQPQSLTGTIRPAAWSPAGDRLAVDWGGELCVLLEDDGSTCLGHTLDPRVYWLDGEHLAFVVGAPGETARLAASDVYRTSETVLWEGPWPAAFDLFLPSTDAPAGSPAPEIVAAAAPTATPILADPLAPAQEALSAYVPVTDTRPVVSSLLSGIAGWLSTGGSPAALERILNATPIRPIQAKHGPIAVTELDLTGDGRDDVVVRIPIMGLPLLVLVEDAGRPARFAGYALPPDLEAIQADFALEGTEVEKPAVQLEDLTGDGVPEVLYTTLFAGGSNYQLRPHAFQWHDGDFRLIFAADVVSWAGTSDYVLEPDPTGIGRLQFVLTYPHLYSHGFDHKMVNHPRGRQVWRWSGEAGRYVLFEETVDLDASAWRLGLPVEAGDRLRWLTDEGEEAFRAGRYGEAAGRYEEVLRRAETEDWRPQEDEADWRAYAAFRRAETLLLLGQSASGLNAMRGVATEMEGDLLGELAQAFLDGYGDGSSPDAAVRGVAAMQALDLYHHFCYERAGALRFPMDAGGILYPEAGLAAYLNAHPHLVGDLAALRAGLIEIGFAVEEVTPLENGDVRIVLQPPDVPYGYDDLIRWQLTEEDGSWRASLPGSDQVWPTVGGFTL